MNYHISELPVGTLLTFVNPTVVKNVLAIVTMGGVVIVHHKVSSLVGQPMPFSWPDLATTDLRHAMWDKPIHWFIVYSPKSESVDA